MRLKSQRLYLENKRLRYWFEASKIHELYRILNSINKLTSNGKYRNFFLTGFSNILKPCSKWLTKSIKPQLDNNKKPADPLCAFSEQMDLMIKAFSELGSKINVDVKIARNNILKSRKHDISADLIITSPPYVTSYEYADLHQLSVLWLGYSKDYKSLRNGTIGSVYHDNSIEQVFDSLNILAKKIVEKLKRVDPAKSRSVTKYFYDLRIATKKIKEITSKNGTVAFIIGNTKYKGVIIDNAKYLSQILSENGFKRIKIAKRKISYKNLTPFRDLNGRFTNDSNGRKVYSHEFIILADR
jgi:hypothetical protein